LLLSLVSSISNLFKRHSKSQTIKKRGYPKSVQKDVFASSSFGLVQGHAFAKQSAPHALDCFIPQKNAGFAKTFLGFLDSLFIS